MAEVLGLAASIIQVAGAGAKLSVALYNFTNSAARADQDIRDIADDVELTSNALETVGKVFESEDAKSIVSKKAIQDANNIIKKCQGVFDEVSEMVEKRMRIGRDGKKSLSMMGKLAWPMKEQRVELNRRRLESLKNSLMLLFHVLQLAKGQSQGMMDKSVMEEERVKVREWHQREQDSLKIQRAVESRFCDLTLDDKGTLQGSRIASRVVTSELMVNTQAMNLPPLEKHSKIQANTITIDLSTVDDSDTSDSNATMTDDENEDHISTEELSRAADHVKGLLKRITVLQKSLATNQKTHRKRHVHKMYQRFCRKFESGINAPQASFPSVHDPLQAAHPHYPLTAAPGAASLPSLDLSGQRQGTVRVQEPLSRQASQQVLQQEQSAVPRHYLPRPPLLEMQRQLAPQQQTATQQQNSQQLAPAPTMNAGPALTPPEIPPYALPDYQLALMLVEQQNRKRLLVSRQEQEDESQPTIDSARASESEQSAKQYPLTTPTTKQIQAYAAMSNADAKSPYKNGMEVRSLSSGDNGWADVDPGHGQRNTCGYSDSSAIMFDSAKPLHVSAILDLSALEATRVPSLHSEESGQDEQIDFDALWAWPSNTPGMGSPRPVRTSANDEAAMDVHSKPHKSAKRGSIRPEKRKPSRRTKPSLGERRSMVVPSTRKPQSTGFVTDEEREGDKEACYRVRTKKRRRIQEADDGITEAEGDLELVNDIVADNLAGHGKERELVETESALDSADRDIVDVLLEQWTVPVY